MAWYVADSAGSRNKLPDSDGSKSLARKFCLLPLFKLVIMWRWEQTRNGGDATTHLDRRASFGQPCLITFSYE
jgi:hypothetical protein